MSINKEKMKEVIHYIVNNYENTISRNSLYKILYFSDFNYYRIYEESMTNETYKKYPVGPLPAHFMKIVSELILEGKIKEVYGPVTVRTNIKVKYQSIKPPKINSLVKEELNVIDSVIHKLDIMDKEEKKGFHKNLLWKKTKNYNVLNYELAETS